MPTRQKIRHTRNAYEFIKAHRKEFSIKRMCLALEVSRAGYYCWLKNPLSSRAKEDLRLLELIRASYQASHDVYGAPRILLDLRERGETCSKHRVEKIMRANKIRALHGYRSPRYVVPKVSDLTPNLLQRQFDVAKPNKSWGTDITYIRTWEGWLYLAVVIDLYSRKVIGWSTRSKISTEVVLDALKMAVRALLTGRRLILMELARAWPGAERVRAPLKRIDRLLGNQHLRQERETSYAAMGRWLIRHDRPIIVIDWSELRDDNRWHVLRAGIPVGGCTLTLLECVYPESMLGSPRAESAFLKKLQLLLPSHIKPILVTDAGFRTPWFKAVAKLG